MSFGASKTTTGDKRRWWALVVLAMTQLVVVLDATIVNVALPSAQAELGMGDSERQWVITAYVLAFGALLLLGGRIADYWGRKRSYIVGMVGFGVASLWGGIAQTSLELIIARGVQGAFAALLAPAALSLLTVTFAAGRERATAFAVFGTVAGTGAAVGLALGGALTEFAGWRWCLLVNLIFAVLGILGAIFFVSESKAEGENKYDIAGLITVVLGLGSLVYGFTLAENGWDSPATILTISAGVALLVVFVWIESRVAQPLLPLRIFASRQRSGAMLLQAIVGAIFVGTTVYFAFQLQVVLGLSPLWAGIGNLAMTAAIIALAPLVTKLFRRFGPRSLMTAGPLVAAGGLVLMSRLTDNGTYWTEMFPGLVLVGIGLAFVVVPLQNVALAGVAPHDAGAASAVVNSSMQVGGSIALAVFTSLFASVGAASGAPEGMTDFVLESYSAVYLASAGVLVAGALVAFFMLGGRRAAAERDAAQHAEAVPHLG